MAGYNITRSVDDLLKKHGDAPPSLTIRLHPDYWTLNNGSKFLYNHQTAVHAMHIAIQILSLNIEIQALLDDIRAQRMSVDLLELFDTARVPFYDGTCILSCSVRY